MSIPYWMKWETLKAVSLKPVPFGLIVSLAAAGPFATTSTSLLHASESPTGSKRWSAGGSTQESNWFRIYSDWPEADDGKPASAGPGNSTYRAPDPNWLPPDISVYSAPNVPPPHPRVTLRDLGDMAQVRTIDAIEKASSSPMLPWQNLKPALSDMDEPTEKDPYLFERVLVVTVAKGTAWSPGDRLVWTRVFVRPINFRFAGYNIASTENETVKISSIEASNTRKLSADMSLTVPGLKDSKIGFTPTQESSLKTTSDISTQYERLGVDILPTYMRVIRESSAGSDVLGNTRIALSITTDPDRIVSGATHTPEQPDIDLVVTDFHESDDAKNITMKVLPMAPLPHCALRAEVWSTYEQRHVNTGAEFYDESRQGVTFMRDVVVRKTVDIVGADDISPYVWQIQLVPAGKKPTSEWTGRQPLQVKLQDGSWRPLIFSDFARAQKLAHWVRTHGGKDLAQYQTNYGDSSATTGMGLAVVKHTQDDCQGNNTPLASIMTPEPNGEAPRSSVATVTASAIVR